MVFQFIEMETISIRGYTSVILGYYDITLVEYIYIYIYITYRELIEHFIYWAFCYLLNIC